jgi:hypothetical protein
VTFAGAPSFPGFAFSTDCVQPEANDKTTAVNRHVGRTMTDSKAFWGFGIHPMTHK